MLLKSLSCWNQQTLPLPFFLKQVPDSEKCPYSQAQTEGLNLKECVCVRERAGDSYRESRGSGYRASVYALPYKHVATAYCGIKTFHNEFVQIVSSLLLLSLINSMRWLDGSLHTVFGGQPSSPYQLAFATPPKTDRNTTLCIDLRAHIHSDTDTPIPPYQTDGKDGVKPPATILQLLDWVRSLKIYGLQAVSSFFYAFLHHLSLLLLSFTRHTFCWSCWHKLKNLIVVFRFLAGLCWCPD